MDTSTSGRPRIVAHKKDGTLLKGYPLEAYGLDPQLLNARQPASFPVQFEMELEDGGQIVMLTRDSLKAVFFVRSFIGKKEYNEVKFFEAHPPVEGLWVRLRYQDGEVTEGVVFNSLALINEPGFFLKPPDPNSNNQMVYVLKSSVREFRVLGVKGTY